MTTNQPLYTKEKHEQIAALLDEFPHKLQLASVLADYMRSYTLLYEEYKKAKEDYQRLYEEFDMYVDENAAA